MTERRSRRSVQGRDDHPANEKEKAHQLRPDISPEHQHDDFFAMQDSALRSKLIEPAAEPFLDVTVLAFAQWVSELRQRQHNAQHVMHSEMSLIRNAISSNNQDLGDFKRHSAQIQQHMQREISEIRDSLSSVFMEITTAVRNNAAADQDIKMKIQGLNEQVVRNDTAFAQLSDAADQSQTKLRTAVTDMQQTGDRMREELAALNRYSEQMDYSAAEKFEYLMQQIERLHKDQEMHLESRKEHSRAMLVDANTIDSCLQTLVQDFDNMKKTTNESYSKLQSSVSALESREMQSESMRQQQGRSFDSRNAGSTQIRQPFQINAFRSGLVNPRATSFQVTQPQ